MTIPLLSLQSALDFFWLIFLLAILRHFWQNRQQLAQAKSWLITRGRITRFEWTQEAHHLWPKIEYTYQVFEQDFQSQYFFLDTSHNNPTSQYARKVAYRAAVAYEKNAEIDVYYNPNNPQQAALDISMPRKLNIIIGLLLVLIVFHLVISIGRLL